MNGVAQESAQRAPVRHGKRDAGFTYLGLLITVAVIGTAAAATLQVGSVLQRRAAEEELLAIGAEFRNALISYANATPAGQKRQPSSLADLLKDPRYPSTMRHLRKLYADPLSGKTEWGIVGMPGSGIIGIHSLSTAAPIKIDNFDLAFADFKGKTSYAEWKFMANAQQVFPGKAPPSSAPRDPGGPGPGMPQLATPPFSGPQNAVR